MALQPQHKKGLIIVGSFLTLAILAFGGYKLYKKHYANTHNKSYYVNYLVGQGMIIQSSASAAMNAGDGYIEAWYNAAKKGNETFDFEGKKYLTKGGRAVK